MQLLGRGEKLDILFVWFCNETRTGVLTVTCVQIANSLLCLNLKEKGIQYVPFFGWYLSLLDFSCEVVSWQPEMEKLTSLPLHKFYFHLGVYGTNDNWIVFLFGYTLD